MFTDDPIIKDLDNDCPNSIETHLATKRINVTDLYGSFEIPLLSYFLLYRNSDIDSIRQLICLCLAYGADINRVVMDTDGDWSYPLYIMFSHYIGMAIDSNTSHERKCDILCIIELLLTNGADPSIILPDGSSIAQTVGMLRTESETKENTDMKILFMTLGC